VSGVVRLHPAAVAAFVLAILAPAALPTNVAGQGAVRCERCHGDREFLAGKGGSPAAVNLMFVPDSILRGTEHDTLSCRSCHTNYDESYPHQPTATTATCASCHEAQQDSWLQSMHAIRDGSPDPDEPTCSRCHGVHRVLGPEIRESPIHPLNEAALCGECHTDDNILAAYFADPADSIARSAVSQYHETVHGLALERAGLVVSATCSDCHRPHRVLPSDSVLSSIARDSIPGTCGACHEGVLEDYRESAHGQAFATGETGEDGHEAPVCNTCHSAHGIAPPDQSWKAGVIEECGVCHERLYETYFETYHGKVTRLGGEIAARCSDCHTPHRNLAADDPASTVHATNRLETCAQCHGEATAGFISYLPHADHTDRERYPQLYWTWLAMTSLLVGVFVFFGAHTLLWLTRATLSRARGAGPARVPPAGGRAGTIQPPVPETPPPGPANDATADTGPDGGTGDASGQDDDREVRE
jgi:hypothetical protein